MKNHRLVAKFFVGLLVISLLLTTRLAQATPPISGNTISFGSPHNLGESPYVRSVALGDLDGDGDLDVVSGGGDPSGGPNEIVVWENDRSTDDDPFSSAWASQTVGTSANPVYSVAVGDLDNDGDLDVVSGGEAKEVIVWENDGTPFDGAWTQGAVGTSTREVNSVTLADLDTDGDLDIVSGSGDSSAGGPHEILAWENDWDVDGDPFDGTWTSQNVGVCDDVVYAVVSGDLDGDGNIDVVSACDADEDNEIVAWENGGAPFGGSWVQHDIGATDEEARTVALGDLDHDGDLDVVSGGLWYAIDYKVVAWENDGQPFDGLWSENDVGHQASGIYAVSTGDLDNDGDLDIVSASRRSGGYELIVWQNDGTPFAGLWSQHAMTADTLVFSIALGDLDGDGDLDVVSGSATLDPGYEVLAWENRLVHRNMPFDPGGHGAGVTDDYAYAVALGDLDNDGDLDIVTGSWEDEDYEVIAWENEGAPFAGLWTQHDVGACPDGVLSLAVADLDGDGDLDILSGTFADLYGEGYEEFFAWENDLDSDGDPFDGSWASHPLGDTTYGLNTIAVGDLDVDGDLDVVTGRTVAEPWPVFALQAWQNDGTPLSGEEWDNYGVASIEQSVRAVALGDLDGDGRLDIVSGQVESSMDPEIAAWQNDGTPFTDTWPSNAVGESAGTVFAVALGDLDGDGDLDVVSGNQSTAAHEVVAWENTTPFSGTWASNGIGTSPYGVTSVALGDLDNDGDLDVVSATGSDSGAPLITWENDGTPFAGLWAQQNLGTSADDVRHLALGDLDDDGDLDAVSSGSVSASSDEVVAWQNVGGAVTEQVTTTAPSQLVSGDTDDLLRVVVAHEGVAGDNDLELARWNLLLQEAPGDPLTTSEANALIETLYVYASADNSWGPTDTQVVALPTLSLNGGIQTVDFSDADPNVQITVTGPMTYFVAIERTSTFPQLGPSTLWVTFDPDADSIVQDRSADASVSVADTSPGTTGQIILFWDVYLPLTLKAYPP